MTRSRGWQVRLEIASAPNPLPTVNDVNDIEVDKAVDSD